MLKIYKMNIEAWRKWFKYRIGVALDAYDDNHYLFDEDQLEELVDFIDSNGKSDRLFDISERILADKLIPAISESENNEYLVEFYEAIELANEYIYDANPDWKSVMDKDEVTRFYEDIADDIFDILEKAYRYDAENKNGVLYDPYKYKYEEIEESIITGRRAKYVNFNEFEKAFYNKEEVE